MWGVDQDSSYFVIWFFFLHWILPSNPFFYWIRRRRSRDGMVVGFTTNCAISPYHHESCEFEPRSWRGVLDTTLCDKVCQWLAAGRWFSPGPPVSSTNKTDLQDITEILLIVALNAINQTNPLNKVLLRWKIWIYQHFLLITKHIILFLF